MAQFRSIGDAVAEAALGGLTAQKLLFALRAADDHGDDLLYDALARVLDRKSPTRLRGFCRQLEKALREAAR